MEKYIIKADFKRPIDISRLSSLIYKMDAQNVEIEYSFGPNEEMKKLILERRTMGPLLSVRFLPIGMASGLFLYTSLVYEKYETVSSAIEKMSPPILLLCMLCGGALLQALGFVLGSKSVTHVLKYQGEDSTQVRSILFMNSNDKIKNKIVKTLTKYKAEKIDIKSLNSNPQSEVALEFRV